MSTQLTVSQSYTIMEAATLSGLPESTLRYYETIGLIQPIARGASSKHRVYGEDDVNVLISVACLSATGMSINDMRSYLKNRSRGAQAAREQIALLETQQQRLENEAHFLKLRQRYIDMKIAYWQAVEAGDTEQVLAMREKADTVSKELKQLRET